MAPATCVRTQRQSLSSWNASFDNLNICFEWLPKEFNILHYLPILGLVWKSMVVVSLWVPTYESFARLASVARSRVLCWSPRDNALQWLRMEASGVAAVTAFTFFMKVRVTFLIERIFSGRSFLKWTASSIFYFHSLGFIHLIFFLLCSLSFPYLVTISFSYCGAHYQFWQPFVLIGS